MKTGGAYWIYGRHAVFAALNNPKRMIRQVLLSPSMQQELAGALGKQHYEVADGKRFDKLLTPDAVHQGIAVEVHPLPMYELEDVAGEGKTLLLLDQVTDPHNVGAILRSAAAFDAGAVIVHDRHAPKESGVMAKAACGALELVPLISVGNIVAAMKALQELGYWCVGMDGVARVTLHQAKLTPATTVLVLGAEGDGMRRLTAEKCDMLVKLPIHAQMESLNVSNAAAIALYEMYKSRT
jgi:23S rRNA (guanosine2251-2'-O)-methyltransferase